MTKIIIYTKYDAESGGQFSFKFKPSGRDGYLRMFMMNRYERYVPVIDYIPEECVDGMFNDFVRTEFEEQEPQYKEEDAI